MTVIEIPDHEAAALTAKAEALGLSLLDYLRKLATEAAPRENLRSPKEAAARILELQKRVKPDPEGWTIRDYVDHGRR